MRAVGWLERTQYATAGICAVCAVLCLVWLNPATAPGLFCLAVVLGAQPGFRRSAMRSGWLLGRSALLQSQREARNRGLTEEQWLTAEFERDIAVMRGAPILLPEQVEDDGD